MFWAGCPLWSIPHFVGMSSFPGYCLVLVFLLFWWSSHSVEQGYKATFLPVARVSLCGWENSTSGGGQEVTSSTPVAPSTSLSILLTWRGTYPLHPPFGLSKPWPSSMSSCVGHGVHHPMASMGKDVIPSAKCTCSFWCLHLLHVTWCLHPSSVDTPVDVHGRNHNFPVIHPREVLLARHWVTTWPLLSCGIITFSLPLEVGLHGVGWYMCPVHDGHLYTRECQPLMQQEEVSFSGGCVTIYIGPSLHRRRCMLWSDVPPCMSPLPTYPRSSSFP